MREVRSQQERRSEPLGWEGCGEGFHSWGDTVGQDLPDSDSTQECSWKINNCFAVVQLLSRVRLSVTQ